VYAADVARIMMLALERSADAEAINAASPDAIPIRDLVRAVLRATDFSDANLHFDVTKPDGHPRRAPSCRRAAERLGFSRYTPLEEGLQRTVGWYRQAHSRPGAKERIRT
jgi:nucleoside-diphosphate-sugar epimerase